MHDDWVWHRSSDRFVRNMLTIGSSGINQALSKELTFVTLDAVSERHPNLGSHLVGTAGLAGLQILSDDPVYASIACLTRFLTLGWSQLYLMGRFLSCLSTPSLPATKTSAASCTQARSCPTLALASTPSLTLSPNPTLTPSPGQARTLPLTTDQS